MDSYATRGNTVFCTFTTCLGFFAALNYFSAKLYDTTAKADMKVHKIYDMTINSYLDSDQCSISLDIDHDLSSEFHWNMNQLFVYITANYETEANHRNEVTIYDTIVTNPEEAVGKLKDVMNEYPLRDQFRQLRGKNITLRMMYRTMPIVGQMHTKEAGTGVSFKSPDNYFRKS